MSSEEDRIDEEEVEALAVEEEEEDAGYIVLSPELAESMLQYIDILEKLSRGELSKEEAKGLMTLIKPAEVKRKSKKTSKSSRSRSKTGKTKKSK